MAWQPDYVSVADLKRYVRIPSADIEDDAELATAITSASRAIDRSADRQFGQTAAVEDRFYTGRFDRWASRWVIDIDDVMTETGLVVAADRSDDGSFSTPIDTFRLHPFNAEVESRPWTKIIVGRSASGQPNECEGAVRVTAQFGWLAIPVAIVQATLLQASRFFARRNAPFGIAGSPDVGSEMRLLNRVDPDVEVSLGPYRRQWGAA